MTATFEELSYNELLAVDGGDLHDTFMSGARFLFVAGGGAIGGAIGAAAGTAFTGGVPSPATAVGAVIGGAAGGDAAAYIWDRTFK